MQDRYAGDVGDFGKFGLLRAVSETGLKVGVNWYKSIPPKSEMNGSGKFKNNDGKYGISARDALCDTALADVLNIIFNMGEGRSTAALEKASLIGGAEYFGAPVRVIDRSLWHKEAMRALSACDVVFLDPDTGLLPASTGRGSAKSVKYVFDGEISDYLAAGKSVICYQHRQRLSPEKYFGNIERRLECSGAKYGAFAVTFRRGTVRDYFVIPADECSAEKLRKAAEKMEAGRWGRSGFMSVQALPYKARP